MMANCLKVLLAAAAAAGVHPMTASAAPVPGQGTWETSLLARDWAGNGAGIDAYYDPVLDITWLADANFAKSSGFNVSGLFNFDDAQTWAASLELFGSADWRLPTLAPVSGGAAFNLAFSNNGSTDQGYARTGIGWGTRSELGYMFYVHLGNRGLCTPDDASPGACVAQAGDGLTNTGAFENLGGAGYWTNVGSIDTRAWSFMVENGLQDEATRRLGLRAWAVHDGDVIGLSSSAVPEPATLGLALAALAALWHAGRRSAASAVRGTGESVR